jgi:DNA anti-recombination protein RmuC
MGSIAERVVEVEVKVDTFRTDVAELKGSIAKVETELKGTIANVETELKGTIARVETELKGAITALGTELKTMNAALDARMERRFDAVDRRFHWVLGIQFTTLLTIIAGLFGMITRLL